MFVGHGRTLTRYDSGIKADIAKLIEVLSHFIKFQIRAPRREPPAVPKPPDSAAPIVLANRRGHAFAVKRLLMVEVSCRALLYHLDSEFTLFPGIETASREPVTMAGLQIELAAYRWRDNETPRLRRLRQLILVVGG